MRDTEKNIRNSEETKLVPNKIANTRDDLLCRRKIGILSVSINFTINNKNAKTQIAHNSVYRYKLCDINNIFWNPIQSYPIDNSLNLENVFYD
jgi:hypothetical protein